MTTWHNDFSEGIWFAAFAAHNDESEINKIIILDMTNGSVTDRINDVLVNLKEEGKNNRHTTTDKEH